MSDRAGWGRARGISLLCMCGGALWALSNYIVIPLVKLLGIGLGFSLYHFVNLVVGYTVGRFGLFGLPRLKPKATGPRPPLAHTHTCSCVAGRRPQRSYELYAPAVLWQPDGLRLPHGLLRHHMATATPWALAFRRSNWPWRCVSSRKIEAPAQPHRSPGIIQDPDCLLHGDAPNTPGPRHGPARLAM